LIQSNEIFVAEILSLPGISTHLITILKENESPLENLNFMTLFYSFTFLKKQRENDLLLYDEEEKKENLTEQMGALLSEGAKSLRKMLIFSNTFDLLLNYFMGKHKN
jgi:hypothetical protein